MSRNDFLNLWPELSQSAQDALLDTARLLVDRYTGNIELQCNDGGVRKIVESQEYQPGRSSK